MGAIVPGMQKSGVNSAAHPTSKAMAFDGVVFETWFSLENRIAVNVAHRLPTSITSSHADQVAKIESRISRHCVTRAIHAKPW